MKFLALVPMLICLMLLHVGADAEIYKWVNKGGNPHYSDTPPPGDEVVYETLGELSPSSPKETMDHSRESHLSSSESGLYCGKPLYFWRDQFEMLNSKIAMKQKDIRLLKSAIDKTDMYEPEKRSGMIIYPRELRVDGRLLSTRDQFTEEWTRQTEQLRELEEELQRLRERAKLVGLPRWLWED